MSSLSRGKRLKDAHSDLEACDDDFKYSGTIAMKPKYKDPREEAW